MLLKEYCLQVVECGLFRRPSVFRRLNVLGNQSRWKDQRKWIDLALRILFDCQKTRSGLMTLNLHLNLTFYINLFVYDIYYVVFIYLICYPSFYFFIFILTIRVCVRVFFNLYFLSLSFFTYLKKKSNIYMNFFFTLYIINKAFFFPNYIYKPPIFSPFNIYKTFFYFFFHLLFFLVS